MTIKRWIRFGAGILMGMLLVSALIFALGVNKIRIGGTQSQALELASDLEADVLPSPLFLASSYLEATKLVVQPNRRDERIATLSGMQQKFFKTRDEWLTRDLPEALRGPLAGPVTRPGVKLWEVIDRQLIPAVRNNDIVGQQAALAAAGAAFDEHRRGIDQLTAAAETHQARLVAEAQSSLLMISLLLLALGAVMIGGTFWAALLLRRRVVTPLSELTNAAALLAGGGKGEVPHTDRDDELGQLAQALAHFRDSAAERAEAEHRDAEEKSAMVDMLADVLSRVSRGDLRKVLDGELEGEYRKLGDYMNKAISTLREMVQNVVFGASSIRSAAGEIASASADLSARTQSNAASIEETTAALTAIDGRLASTRDAAKSTAQSAERARTAVERGLAKAQSAAATMEEVRTAAASVDGVMEALDKIAFQTRVLAMNAAVEAGHAGEAGKGFAVVADLVSQLAARAEEEARSAREQLTATTERIALAAEGVSDMEVQFGGIVSEVASVSELVEQLSADALAQAMTIAEISSAMRQMDISTQQNAAMVEQTSAAAANLLGDAGQLVDHAERFKWDRREANIPVAVDRRGKARPSEAQLTIAA